MILFPTGYIRKQWFISPEGTSKLVDNMTVDGIPVIDYFGLTPYANVKFGVYQDIMGKYYQLTRLAINACRRDVSKSRRRSDV